MACVWKHPECNYWFARFRDERGVWVNRSTRTADRARASEIARSLEHAATLACAGNLTQDRARALVSEILERTTGGAESVQSETVEQFFSSHRQTLAGTVSDGTLARYKGVMARFEAHLGSRAKRVLNGILPKDVQSYVTARSREVEASTVASDLKDLRAVFNSAVELGVMDKQPARGIRMPQGHALERDVFNPGQLRLLLSTATGDWKTAILFGCFVGARLGDVVKLRWSDVDFSEGEGGTISFKQSKATRSAKGSKLVRTLKVPLATDLRVHLESIASDQAEEFIMPSLANRRPGGRNGLSGSFVRIVEKAGIDPRYVEAKGKRFAKLSFHSLRHGFNSALANADVSQEMRMKLTGHLSAAVNSRYTHHDIATLGQAVAKLPRIST